MFISYLSLGALAVTANAFLVPLYTSTGADNDLTITPVSEPITLDCSNCPYALKSERNGQHEWIDSVPNEIKASVEVSGNAIAFNGVNIYPITNPTLPPVLTVEQTIKKGLETSMEGLDHALRLSYSLSVAERSFEDGNSLITISISPMALDGQMIRIDDLEIKAIKDSAGTITLHSTATTTPPANAPDAQCTNVMCRVMSKLLSGIARVKTSAKTAAHKLKCLCVKCLHCVAHMMGHKAHGHHHHNHADGGVPHRLADGTVKLPTHNTERPHHLHPHHGWQHKGFVARMAHVVWVTVKIAFIPILIGVAFGMAASAIGMLVGQAVVFLWIRYRRHDDELPAYVVLAGDEKEEMLGGEVPPPYEDLPAGVREVVEKDVEDKA